MSDKFDIKKNNSAASDEDEETLFEETAIAEQDENEKEKLEYKSKKSFYTLADTRQKLGLRFATRTDIRRLRELELQIESSRSADVQIKEDTKEHIRRLLLKQKSPPKDSSMSF